MHKTHAEAYSYSLELEEMSHLPLVNETLAADAYRPVARSQGFRSLVVTNYDHRCALLRSKKYPYALFFGHLALEKLLKAVVVKRTGEHAPYSHSLMMLAQRAKLEMPEEMLDSLAEFMEFHTEARYPDVKMDFYLRCTPIYAREKFREIKKVFLWCLKTLET